MAICFIPKISKYALKKQLETLRVDVGHDLRMSQEALRRAYENYLFEAPPRASFSRVAALAAEITWLNWFRDVQLASMDFEEHRLLREKWDCPVQR